MRLLYPVPLQPEAVDGEWNTTILSYVGQRCADFKMTMLGPSDIGSGGITHVSVSVTRFASA